MIDYTVYKLIHFLGIIMIFVSLGGVMVHVFNGGAKADNAWRKPAGITHGIGLFLVLLGGFGMMARLGIHWPWPGWLVAKLAIWLVLGGITAVVYRLGAKGKSLWAGVVLLGAIAAYMAIMKPL